MKRKHVQKACPQWFIRFLTGALLTLPFLTQGQYLETFFGQVGKGIFNADCSNSSITSCSPAANLSGVNWTLEGNFSDVDGDNAFGVVSFGPLTFFKVSDVDNELCWVSPELDISSAGPVSILVGVSRIGDLESSDGIRAYYSVNGGSFNQFGSRSGNFSPATLTTSGVTGNTLVIKICAETDRDNESIYFDNIIVPQFGVRINNGGDDDEECGNHDQQDPNAICKNVTIQLEDGVASITPETVNNESTDNCEIESMELSRTSFDCEDVGEPVAVTLTVSDQNENTDDCIALVTVEDHEDPDAVCTNTTVELDSEGYGSISTEDIDNGSDDECGIEIIELSRTSFSCEDLGSVTVTLTVTDVNDNESSCTATVYVEDNIDPEIECNSLTVTFNGEGAIELDPADLAGASDNCGIESLSADQEYISCFELGEVVPVEVTAYDDAGNSASCTSYVTVEGLPCAWMYMPNGIGCPEGNDASYDVPSETFSLTATHCYTPSAMVDESGFIKFPLCGDGSITAHIAGLTLPGFAGIVMRESDVPGAKKVAMAYQGVNSIARYVRYTDNGMSFPSYIPTSGSKWLRITRVGSRFQGFHSVDGVTWIYSFTVIVPMNECIQVGLIAWGMNPLATVTATFDHVVVDPPYGMYAPKTAVTPDVAVAQSTAVDLWPNPAAEEAILTLDAGWIATSGPSTVNVELVDQLGRRVKSLQADPAAESNIALDLRDQAPGVYFVKVRNQEGRTATLRLLVTRP